MSVIFILIGVSLIVASGFLISFIWSVKSGQYEDSYTPSVRILFDDVKQIQPKPNKAKKNKPKPKNRKRWKFKSFITTTRL